MADTAQPEIVTMFPGRKLESLPRREVFTATRTLLDKLEPEVIAVTAYSKPEAQSALVWARDRRRTAIVMTQSRREDVSRLPIREAVKRSIVSQFDAALAGGSAQARYIEELGVPPRQIFTPYAVVHNAFFAKAAASARRDPSSHRHLPGLQSPGSFFLTSTRFIKRKNLARLLEGYERYVRLNDDRKAWRLIILGDGPERESLMSIANKGIARDAITFAGYRQADEAAVYYGLASAFVHPPTTDQWGLVVNEAMAAGLPVLVSTGAGAAEDLVENGINGLTFDPLAPAAIADAMRRISGPDVNLKAMGRRSSEIIASWAPERFAAGLWEAVCAGARSADHDMPLGVRVMIWGNQIMPRILLRWRSVNE
jgi:glycosyltransferase involved in cell wall biosynthesis